MRTDLSPGASCGQDVQGLALLAHKGLATWIIRAAQSGAHPATEPPGSTHAACCTTPSTGTPSSVSFHIPAHAPGMQRMLVDIVAAMTLAHTLEVHA